MKENYAKPTKIKVGGTQIKADKYRLLELFPIEDLVSQIPVPFGDSDIKDSVNYWPTVLAEAVNEQGFNKTLITSIEGMVVLINAKDLTAEDCSILSKAFAILEQKTRMEDSNPSLKEQEDDDSDELEEFDEEDFDDEDDEESKPFERQDSIDHYSDYCDAVRVVARQLSKKADDKETLCSARFIPLLERAMKKLGIGDENPVYHELLSIKKLNLVKTPFGRACLQDFDEKWFRIATTFKTRRSLLISLMDGSFYCELATMLRYGKNNDILKHVINMSDLGKAWYRFT